MTKVLWFSRHEMTEDQLGALVAKLGEVEVNHVDRTIQTAFELSEEVEKADVIAIVAPINLQAQFLELAKEKPVIIAQSKRELVKNSDGTESKVNFIFDESTEKNTVFYLFFQVSNLFKFNLYFRFYKNINKNNRFIQAI